ncbi:DnaB-like helicase N-terminal domain-containing protein [Streptomyces iconiensis]|uniref:DnaB-like helicase N-terminal domain-containing protein n=1 Tax=Streptomyces iconiensis TaxID=1384038 RepID=A0ABT6ZSI0_9ACTN|nr:DnaB-like helicase N-terminal domain-containing protein [Streptomyces iconiensis]MDJ1131999.1 DnaB-like helicase N-terminal domain-containing protein [Streptomyces iconiensis]
MTPLLRAEQAVLGAVLLEPRQLGRLAGWLRPEHFYRPAHSALYAAMLTLRTGSHPATKLAPNAPVPLAWLNDIREEASTRTRGVTTAYVHSLASACPRPAHAPVYGRMVLEGAIHRSVTQHAVRLHQAARADTARASGVDETLHHAQVLHDVLDDLSRRWGFEPRPVEPNTASPEPTAPATGQVAERVLADEEFLLGALTAHPEQLSRMVGWLRPDDFADPGHQQVYRALGALRHRGEPVDELTVLWECQRRGALTDGSLDAERVRRICHVPVAGSADHFAEQVLDSSLLRTAATSARQVGALAEDESLAPGRLISHALHALVPLDEVRRRRAAADAGPEPEQATGQPSGPPPAARAAAARAGSSAPPRREQGASERGGALSRPLCPTFPKEFSVTAAAERTESEQAQLLLVAENMERLRADITVPSSPTDQPDLIGASRQLASLTGLVRHLSDEVLFRPVKTVSRPNLDRVMSAYTDAAGQAGESGGHYSVAYVELGFQHRYRGRVSPGRKAERSWLVNVVWTCGLATWSEAHCRPRPGDWKVVRRASGNDACSVRLPAGWFGSTLLCLRADGGGD